MIHGRFLLSYRETHLDKHRTISSKQFASTRQCDISPERSSQNNFAWTYNRCSVGLRKLRRHPAMMTSEIVSPSWQLVNFSRTVWATDMLPWEISSFYSLVTQSGRLDGFCFREIKWCINKNDEYPCLP